MSAETVKRIYEALKNSEPQTPYEIAKTLGINQKTAQSVLLEMVLTRKNVRLKKIGRYRIFWKVTEGEADGK
jgi:predicted ArsR family transcriptional regulator